MKELNLLVWLTQLGISVAVPLCLCTFGALWLKNTFSLGLWVLFVGVGLGLYLAVDAFRISLRNMERLSRDPKKEKDKPPVSFNDHD